jgi:hypothetical protein
MKMGPTRCPETSVNNYHTTPCNYSKDHRLHQHRGWKPEIKNKKVGKEKSAEALQQLPVSCLIRMQDTTFM